MRLGGGLGLAGDNGEPRIMLAEVAGLAGQLARFGGPSHPQSRSRLQPLRTTKVQQSAYYYCRRHVARFTQSQNA